VRVVRLGRRELGRAPAGTVLPGLTALPSKRPAEGPDLHGRETPEAAFTP